MAIKRPKTYKNFVPPDTGKAYQITGNSNGTSKITDVTVYITKGDNWTAADANMIWDELENVITGGEKGVAGGVASLDSSGKVPSGQLPSMNYIPTSEKGAEGGVAPMYTYGTTEMTAGTTELETGKIYLQYE